MPPFSRGRDSATVIVLDRSPRHRTRIDRVISQCNARPWRNVGLGEEEPMGLPCRVLLVELQEQIGLNAPLMGSIQRFKQKGFSLVAFGEGVERWPVRDRSSLLLAGVSYLLDASGAEFEDDLRRLLSELLSAEVGQQEEEERIKQAMAAMGIVGVSAAMLAVFRTVLRIGVLSELPALLVGETGTGKELLAHAVHALDPNRCKGPFIAVNCAALAPTLAESILFGHRRGAFTGAERDRRGLIRAAHGGVLFLDEIGELDGPLQAKLLRVLQENRVLSIGDEQELPISVRVVAATNRDLAELVREGRFRPDLYHRLNVICVHIPALRERPEDVEALTLSFVSKYAALGREERTKVAPDFIEALRQADLPGNVRQLENLVRHALVNKRKAGPALSLSDLPTEIWQQLSEQQVVTDSVRSESCRQPARQAPGWGDSMPVNHQGQWEEILEAHGGNLARCLESCERSLLAAALHRTRGNQSQTARLLGITPRSVYNKLHKHQLRP